MLQLDKSAVELKQSANTKAEALALVSKKMQDLGLANDFLPYLLGRESIASTYLGAGIAIPHGTQSAKANVKKTGVVVVHFDKGVDWGNGDTVYVAVGIAAKSDEHLDILRQIARLLDNDNLQDNLKNASSESEIIALLSGEQGADEPANEQNDLPKPKVARFVRFGLNGTSDDLLRAAHSLLREQGFVAAEFAGGLKAATWLKLAEGIWCIQTTTGVKKTAIALVGEGRYDGQAVKTLVVVAQNWDEDPYDIEPLLDELLKTQKELQQNQEVKANQESKTDTAEPAQKALDKAAIIGAFVSQKIAAQQAGSYVATPTQDIQVKMRESDGTKVVLDNDNAVIVSQTKTSNQSAQSQESQIGTTILLNEHGLHARPATFLANLCKDYAGKIEVGFGLNDLVSAKSMPRLLALGATHGKELTVKVTGDNAVEWLGKVLGAIESGLGEEVTPINATKAEAVNFLDKLLGEKAEKATQNNQSDKVVADVASETVADTVTIDIVDSNVISSPFPSEKAIDTADELPESKQAVEATKSESAEPIKALDRRVAYTAQVACKGFGVAAAYVVKPTEFVFERQSSNALSEKRLLEFALDKAKQALNERIANAKKPNIAEIFSAHLVMMSDEELFNASCERIETGLSAAAAFDDEIKSLAKAQAALDNPILAERADDWYDIGEQVLSVLCGQKSNTAPDTPYILVKNDLLPSDVANLDEKVVAILTAQGGTNSHSAIIARSLGIPTLVGAGGRILAIEQGERVLIDAVKGEFVVSPDENLVQAILASQQILLKKQALAKENAHKPAITTDNHHIELAVNLGDVDSVDAAIEQGAEGVGLLRTEFVFMKHKAMPDKATQMADYGKVFLAMQNRPVVVRTLDVGGDKPLPYLPMDKEENPFLGVRGVRLSLDNPDSLREQVAALIESSVATSRKLGLEKHAPLRIMFPMIGQLKELRAAKAIVNEVLAVTPHDNLQIGMMIEVPSAAILADKFAPEVDFFSIGTNDLTQYALAIDRGHPKLSDKADGLDPSILRFIELTIRAAKTYGKWVGICGELAADSVAVPILVGLGVNELSVSASQIAMVKAQIRTLNYAECQKLADRALISDSAEQIRAFVNERFGA